MDVLFTLLKKCQGERASRPSCFLVSFCNTTLPKDGCESTKKTLKKNRHRLGCCQRKGKTLKQKGEVGHAGDVSTVRRH
jgi:hypothetical protein